jgi:hypothetical protein
MRKLRELADRTGSTVRDLIHEGILDFVAKSEAERELETKIVRLPERLGLLLHPLALAQLASRQTYTRSPKFQQIPRAIHVRMNM